jgi:hypothetical protein
MNRQYLSEWSIPQGRCLPLPQHQVGPVRGWKVGEPIGSTMLPNPVSGMDMIGMSQFAETCSDRLLHGEEALLRLGDVIEFSRRFFVRPDHAQSLNILEGLCAIAKPKGSFPSLRAPLHAGSSPSGVGVERQPVKDSGVGFLNCNILRPQMPLMRSSSHHGCRFGFPFPSTKSFT